MARCRCGVDQCSCRLVGGINTSVRGNGSADTPFQVDAQPAVQGAIDFHDGQTVDFTVTGFGTQATPLVITAEAEIFPLINITTGDNDVVVQKTGGGTLASPLDFVVTVPWIDTGGGGGAAGDVLIRGADGVFRPGSVSVPAGTIYVRPGMMGDGSIGNPLGVDLCVYDDMKAPRLCVRGAAQNGQSWPSVEGVTGETIGGGIALATAGFVASPSAAWPTGQHITIDTFRFFWNGTNWLPGLAP